MKIFALTNPGTEFHCLYPLDGAAILSASLVSWLETALYTLSPIPTHQSACIPATTNQAYHVFTGVYVFFFFVKL